MTSQNLTLVRNRWCDKGLLLVPNKWRFKGLFLVRKRWRCKGLLSVRNWWCHKGLLFVRNKFNDFTFLSFSSLRLRLFTSQMLSLKSVIRHLLSILEGFAVKQQAPFQLHPPIPLPTAKLKGEAPPFVVFVKCIYSQISRTNIQLWGYKKNSCLDLYKLIFDCLQTIHEAVQAPLSVLRAIYESVEHDRGRLLERVQRRYTMCFTLFSKSLE